MKNDGEGAVDWLVVGSCVLYEYLEFSAAECLSVVR